jgi:hypothetical protein
VIGNGPVAYYRLGDQSGLIMPDSSGSGNNGTYHGGFTLNQAGAVNDPDGAVLFDGVSGYAQTQNSVSLALAGAVTLEAWVKWTAIATTTQDIVYKGDGATVTNGAYGMSFIPGCSGCGLGFYTYIGNNYACACQSSAIAAGQWHYLVGTRSATGQLSFYVDGALVATGADSGGALNATNARLGIGASGSATSANLYPINGAVDEAAVYPVALTGTQVSTHYHAAGY